MTDEKAPFAYPDKMTREQYNALPALGSVTDADGLVRLTARVSPVGRYGIVVHVRDIPENAYSWTAKRIKLTD